jgi:lipid II:glycine glycyltransferase (peptidoglycan interpeptide bridge formation enzyme)
MSDIDFDPPFSYALQRIVIALNKGYRTIIETGGSDPHWDDVLAGFEHSHHEQSTYWADVKQHQGWQAVRIKVFKGADWLAGAQMLCKKLPFGGSVGFISSGPFYNFPNDPSLDVLIRSINQLAKNRRIQYIAITPYAENAYLDKILEENGYRPTREKLPPTATVRATLIWDLSKDLNTLLLEMKPETRRKIKLALKSDLTVREGDKKDLETLFKLMSIVAEKREEKPDPASVDFFKLLWDCFHPGGCVKLFMVESRDDPISMAFVFTLGNTARFWKYGWSGEEQKKRPNQLLVWEMIQWSKNNGFRYFENIQVDPVITDYLALGLPITDEVASQRLFGPTHFKIGFGGKIVKFSGPWFRFQNPLIRFVYHNFGPSLMRIPYTKKLISRIS